MIFIVKILDSKIKSKYFDLYLSELMNKTKDHKQNQVLTSLIVFRSHDHQRNNHGISSCSKRQLYPGSSDSSHSSHRPLTCLLLSCTRKQTFPYWTFRRRCSSASFYSILLAVVAVLIGPCTKSLLAEVVTIYLIVCFYLKNLNTWNFTLKHFRSLLATFCVLISGVAFSVGWYHRAFLHIQLLDLGSGPRRIVACVASRSDSTRGLGK